MIDTQEVANRYNNLTPDKKRERLINMLEILGEEGTVFNDLYKLIKSYENVPETLMDKIHDIILNAMYKIETQYVEKSIKQLEQTKEKIKSLKEKEKKEEKDNPPEDILENM